MKTCPFCAEEIQNAAVKCKHCFEFLDPTKRPAQLQHTETQAKKGPWYCSTSAIVLTFLTVPPFALIPLWLHPRLHMAWKVAISLFIGATCWAMYRIMVSFVHQFDEATRMLNGMQL